MGESEDEQLMIIISPLFFLFAVELVKETCKYTSSPSSSGSSGSDLVLDPLMIRLFHPGSRKYVCFNRKGKVKTVVSGSLVVFFFAYLGLKMGQLRSFSSSSSFFPRDKFIL